MKILTLKKSYKQRTISIYIMNIESELESKLSCKICNKIYASMSSLCNHNKKFHSKNNIVNVDNVDNSIINVDNSIINVEKSIINVEKSIINIVINKKLQCKFCLVFFKSQSNKCQHEKKHCKVIINNNKKIDDNNELKIKKIELEKINAENEMLRLKIKLQNNNNSTNNTNNNNSTNNTTNNNNGTINNITNKIIVGFCSEDIDIIPEIDKINILNSGYLALVKLIELMHLNKDYPQYQNIRIPNLKDNFAKTYDELTDTFTTVNKKDSIDDLICSRTCDLKSIHKHLSNKHNNFHACVLKLIDKVESCKAGDIDDKFKLDFYKNLQKEVILLIYNKTKIFD
jgi:hypothetical protein